MIPEFMKYKVLAFLGILLILSGCNEYDDGPCLSFKKPDRRLTGSVWKVESFVRNGEDITDQWVTNYNWYYSFRQNEDRDLEDRSPLYITTNIPSNSGCDGSWYFCDFSAHFDYEKLLFSCWTSIGDTTKYGIYPLITNDGISYDIKRLSSSQLWIEHTDSAGVLYQIKFSDI